jgi:hypothetical protein
MYARGRWLLALTLVLGCLPRSTVVADSAEGRFRFPEDAFAFSNETIWKYTVDPASGGVSWYRRERRPAFALRCATLARAARQFHFGARFEPAAPVGDASTYERLVRAVLRTDPRRSPATRVVIPGYADLRSFSAAHEVLLKAALAGPWQSYMQRGNWRMIFPFTAWHQKRLAERLLEALARGWPPVVHVLRYPELTINHLVLVFAAEETPAEIRFQCYDPNDAARPVVLTYDRAARVFSLSMTEYFPGGPVKAYDVYDGIFY